jgi:ABC-type transport system involved in multi-copper enzyme maturation permease subunit
VNPIVRREWLDLLRTRTALVAVLGIAGTAAAMVLARWPAAGVGDLNGASALQVLRVFGYGLLASLILILPAFPATSIVRERVQGTLALLLNSPLSVGSIVIGKYGGVLGFTAVLLAVTMPAAAACYTLGGSSMQGGVGLLYVVLGAAAVQLTAICLFISSRAQSTDGALRTAYSAVLAVCVLPLVARWLIPPDTALLATLATWVGCLSPVPAVMEAVGQGGAGIAGTDYATGAIGRYLILAAATTLLCFTATLVRLYRAPLDRAKPAGVMTQDRSRGQRVARRMFFLVDPNRRSAGTSLLVNPVMVKEFRTRRFGRLNWTFRLVAICAVLSLSLSYLAAAGALGWGLEIIAGALVMLQSALLVLFAPSLSAGLISTERESGGWNLLRATPMSAGKILRGKLMSAVFPVLLLLCATLPGYVVMTTIKPQLLAQVPRVLACLGLTVTLVCVAPFLVWLGRDSPFGHSTVNTALTLSPVATALNAADTPGFTRYELHPNNWWVIGSACVVMLVFLAVRVRQLCRPE